MNNKSVMEKRNVRSKRFSTTERDFTLIELLIVIAIIAFLLGVSITIFCFKLKARQSKKDEGRSQ